jgi:hypothetical protein
MTTHPHSPNEPGGFHRADCPTCQTPNAAHWDGVCETCHFWEHTFGTPGSFIANGWHYVIGDELARHPSHYGHYGSRYLIRFPDGRDVVTHNLGDHGPIPPGLARPDTAEIIREDR